MKVNVVIVLLFLIIRCCHSSYLKRKRNHTRPNGEYSNQQNSYTIIVPVWRSAFNTKGRTRFVRSYLEDWTYKWPGGEVPYIIHESVNEMMKWKILEAIDFFKRKTCIKWLPKNPSDTNYVLFKNGDLPCWSQIGCAGGMQTINLNDACVMDTGHEMMHALGFIHEQMRLDRECYISVRTDMMKTNANYMYYTLLPTDLTWPYDYHSVMHYPSLFGAEQIMRGKGPYYKDEYIGPDKDMSMTELDLWKVNTLYCGKPHYCKVHPEECAAFHNYEDTCLPSDVKYKIQNHN